LIQEFLRQVALFESLEDDDLAHLLMVGMVKRYREGASILTEGVPGQHLHVIRRGQVRISKMIPQIGEEALLILGPKAFFGEMEFLDGAPASANAIAHTSCELFSIPHAELKSLLRSRPELTARFLWAIGAVLSTRLRDTNRKLATLLTMAHEP
jgi:CRP/FNR family transcriptional regulator, cyclic AMP receptor protein